MADSKGVAAVAVIAGLALIALGRKDAGADTPPDDTRPDPSRLPISIDGSIGTVTVALAPAVSGSRNSKSSLDPIERILGDGKPAEINVSWTASAKDALGQLVPWDYDVYAAIGNMQGGIAGFGKTFKPADSLVSASAHAPGALGRKTQRFLFPTSPAGAGKRDVRVALVARVDSGIAVSGGEKRSDEWPFVPESVGRVIAQWKGENAYDFLDAVTRIGGDITGVKVAQESPDVDLLKEAIG